MRACGFLRLGGSCCEHAPDHHFAGGAEQARNGEAGWRVRFVGPAGRAPDVSGGAS